MYRFKKKHATLNRCGCLNATRMPSTIQWGHEALHPYDLWACTTGYIPMMSPLRGHCRSIGIYLKYIP